MTTQAQTLMPPWAAWLAAGGLSVTGVTGVVSTNQLSGLRQAAQEEVRVAELRGRILSDIAATQRKIVTVQARLDETMPAKGILELHASQQSLIDKLIDWQSEVATKNELNLVIQKINSLHGIVEER